LANGYEAQPTSIQDNFKPGLWAWVGLPETGGADPNQVAQETWRIQANLSIPPVLNIRYPGQYYDFESGLVQNWWRTYEPKIGRYTSADPIGLGGGWNRFAYVAGDPLNFTDPRGLNKLDPFFGLPKAFWNWLHKLDGGQYIQSIKEGKNVPEEVAREHYQEWLNSGKPNPRSDQRGIVDQSLLEGLLPWWATPSELAPGTLWGPGTPYPTATDYDRAQNCPR
jgi:RHS repeat-associated protein